MLYGIIGNKGCGKTLLLTYFLKKYFEKDNKIKIFTNYKLNKINFEIIDFSVLFEDEVEIKNAIVGIDEIYLIADCRLSMSKLNKLISYMVYQTRKAGVDIFYTAVLYNSIDIRLRKHTDGIFFPNIYIDGKKILNPEQLTRDKMNNYIKNNHDIKIKGLYHTDYSTSKFQINDPKEIFDYYSSYEIIKPVI